MTSEIKSWRSGVLLLALAAVFAGCSETTPTEPQLEASPAKMDIVSGNQQSGAANSELASPLVVRVVSATGQPISGQVVNFRVTRGGGTVFAGVALTNSQGIAQERWTLGSTVGDPQEVEARSVDAGTGEKRVYATFAASVIDPATQVATVSISPASASLTVGGTQQLAATARNASGGTVSGKTFAWSSSNSGVATVSNSGLVTATAAGSATITATVDGRSGSSTITVSAPPPSTDTTPPAMPGSLNVSTTNVSADSFQVAASWGSVSDAARYSWESASNSGTFHRRADVTQASVSFRAARVTPDGYWFCVNAVDAAGNLGERACRQYVAPAATPPPPAPTPTVTTVTLSPSSLSFTATNQTQTLTASARDQNGNVIQTTYTWRSLNTSVATVNSSGQVTSQANGTTGVIASAPNGAADTAQVTVSVATPPPPTPAPSGAGEATYDASRHTLVLRDNFDSYASKTAMLSSSNYRVNRASEWIALTSGRGGSGQAVRLQYGPQRAVDILFGPDNTFSYNHIYFTTWFRVSAGGDFTAGGTGIKGFMFSNANTGGNGYSSRYQFGVSRVRCWNPWKGYSEARGFLQADANECTGADLFKTSDGGGPRWSNYNDGSWHRVTFEIYTAASGHAGFRQWMDGTLVYDNVDRIPAGHYSPYTWNVTGVQVFGNYYPEGGSTPTTNVDIDFDDWTIWTDR